MTDALKKAIEKADAACPNSFLRDGTIGKCNTDYWCGWTGHTAIRTVARVALEEARAALREGENDGCNNS